MIRTTYPPCPDCGRPMRLVHDTEETLRGAPRTWWCPDCTTHLRRTGDVWDVLDVTPDGRLVRRAAPQAGAHWWHVLQAVLADPRLHPSAKAVYAAVLERALPDRALTATMGQIATWAAVSRVQVWHALRELQAAGWLTWRGRRFAPGTVTLSDPAGAVMYQH
jgi:hypothetical protein